MKDARIFLAWKKNRDFFGYFTFHQLNKNKNISTIYCWCEIFLGMLRT